MNNIVFYFTGTGNSLKIAKTISKALDNAEIVSMGKLEKNTPLKHYDTIGFVYPVYFGGLPNRVKDFVETMDLRNNKNAYFYAVATFGGLPGNSIAQLNDLLLTGHTVKLNYGKEIKMFANYVVAYGMSTKVDAITRKSDKAIIPILDALKKRETKSIKKPNRLFNFVRSKNIPNFKTMDKNYVISADCTGCGICKEVCPVKNIEIRNGKPDFKHTCEQCVACIHYCPQKAINYKHLTQKRGRYTNPAISYKELSERNR